MSHYTVINRETGETVYSYDADSAAEFAGMEFQLYNHVKTIAPTTPPPEISVKCTKRAFQNRFPKLANGVSTKWDALQLFLTDDAYAASIGVSGPALFALRMLITTGAERMSASAFVDMAPTGDAAGLTYLLTQSTMPDVFRISAAERNVMMTTPLAANEIYVEKA